MKVIMLEAVQFKEGSHPIGPLHQCQSSGFSDLQGTCVLPAILQLFWIGRPLPNIHRSVPSLAYHLEHIWKMFCRWFSA